MSNSNKMPVTKEEILKKNGLQIGFKSTYGWDDILKSMDDFRLQFDDQDRANYYEDKIDMLNKLVSPRTEERNALLRKAIKFGNENFFVTKVDEEIRIEEFLKELFMEENGLDEQDMKNDVNYPNEFN